jgi:hypothetical protein
MPNVEISHPGRVTVPRNSRRTTIHALPFTPPPPRSS